MEGGEVNYDIQKKTEALPFESDPSRNLLNVWCEAHSEMKPRFVDRSEYESRPGGFIDQKADGKKELVLPKDIRLWELYQVVDEVDRDTFEDLKRASKGDERRERLNELGGTFVNAAVYMAKRLDSVGQGKEVATELIKGFYTYGMNLRGAFDPIDADLKNIAGLYISDENTKKTDKWLSGDAYSLVLERTGGDEKKMEEERGKMLEKYFRLSDILLKREKEKQNNPDSVPKRSNLSSRFLERLKDKQEVAIEKPKTELYDAIFDRGIETLMNGVLESAKGFVGEQRKLIAEKIDLPGLKDSITKAREDLKSAVTEEEKSEKVRILSDLERKAAETIQSEVMKLQYTTGVNEPKKIVDQQVLNCVGFSLLGGALMDEVGINYVSAERPGHSVLIVVTADKHMRWMDMQSMRDNLEITDGDLIQTNDSNPKVSVESVANDILEGKVNTGHFDLKVSKGTRLSSLTNGNELDSMYVSYGENQLVTKAGILFSIGYGFNEKGMKEEAKMAYRMALQRNPFSVEAMIALGNMSPRAEETCDWYRKVADLDSGNAGVRLFIAGYTKDVDEKEQLLREVVNIESNDAKTRLSLAGITKDMSEKEQLLREALKIQDDIPEASYRLAGLTKNTDEKIALYNKTISLDATNYFVAYYQLGGLYLSIDKQKAAQMLKEYLKRETRLESEAAVNWAKDKLKEIGL